MKAIKRRLDLVRQIPRPVDVFLALRIVAFASITPILLRFKLSRLQKVLKYPPNLPRKNLKRADSSIEGEALKIIPYVDTFLAVGRPFISSNCLVRGMTRYYFLTRAGMEDVNLIFGVEKNGNRFSGHCWLEKDGIPFLEANDPYAVFSPTYRI